MNNNNTQLSWLIGPLILRVRVSPFSRRQPNAAWRWRARGPHTHSALEGRFKSQQLSSFLNRGYPFRGQSDSSVISSWCFFLQASEHQLPLLKNDPTMTTLYRSTLCAIRTHSTAMSGAKFFHRLTESLWIAPSCEMIRGTITAIPLSSREFPLSPNLGTSHLFP